MLEANDITVRFGGVTALAGVSLALEAGEILAVIGPNGSGKSTLFNAITGFVTPTEGSVSVDGRVVTRLPAHRRARMGLARTFQTPRIDMEEPVRDAVLCGFFPRARSGLTRSLLHTPGVRREERELRAGTEELLLRFGLSELAATPMGELPMGLVRVVDVARSMAMGPSYLLLDEPAAGLTRDEQKLLVREIRRVASEGVGVVLVEHNFGLVRHVSDRVLVLNQGRLIASGVADEVARDPQVVNAYLGVSEEEAAVGVGQP